MSKARGWGESTRVRGAAPDQRAGGRRDVQVFSRQAADSQADVQLY